MSLLTDHGCILVPSKPNAEGLCTFKLMRGNEELVHTDDPSTLEYALIAARNYLEKMESEEE